MVIAASSRGTRRRCVLQIHLDKPNYLPPKPLLDQLEYLIYLLGGNSMIRRSRNARRNLIENPTVRYTELSPTRFKSFLAGVIEGRYLDEQPLCALQ